MDREFKGRPPRLREVFQTYSPALYFVTFNTLLRRRLLANDYVQDAFRAYAARGVELGKAFIGCYVIMPDHVHLFVALAPETTLIVWESGLKKALSRGVVAAVTAARGRSGENAGETAASTSAGETPAATFLPLPDGTRIRVDEIWQPGFFDHLLRNDESYAEKWNYVRENPVRAGLVKQPEDWPYQGEIVPIDRV